MAFKESFTEEEKNVLLSFCSNVDKPIFVLRNLPEVIKGALFSRYSRSAKGLRRLLLDDFINSEEGGFKDIVESGGQSGVNQALAIQKAQEFYTRILDGFGDDSIGELGGAHLACEQVSIIATKILEDPRIGGSPLEKSTRYIRFDDKVDAKYRFCREPAIMASKHAKLYEDTCNMLFDTYSKLLDILMERFKKIIPKEEKASDRAYNFSIRAKACDALRGMLPASTMTNMGIFGNGRFFDSLIIRLRTYPLKEMHELADQIQGELNTAIPSFVRRAMPNHLFFPAFKSFLDDTRIAVENKSKELTGDVAPEPAKEDVTLVDYDADAEEKVISAILYPNTNLSLSQLRKLVKEMSTEKRLEVIKEYCSHRTNRRHKPGRALENVHYTFDILADYGSFRDLHRHRMLTQERQQLSPEHGYYVSPDVKEAGVEKEYTQALEKAAEAHKIISADLPREAQYVVPLAYNIRWYFKMTLREVYWLSELRSTPQGHPTYRYVAQEMYKRVKEVHPALAEYMKFVDMNDYELARIGAEMERDQNKHLI